MSDSRLSKPKDDEPERVRYYQLGLKAGRQEVIDKLIEVLDLRKLIQEEIKHHEKTYHE